MYINQHNYKLCIDLLCNLGDTHSHSHWLHQRSLMNGVRGWINTHLHLKVRRWFGTLVCLRIALSREMVFTLCLQLILDQFFLRNLMVPTDFWKKVPKVPKSAQKCPPGAHPGGSGWKSHYLAKNWLIWEIYVSTFMFSGMPSLMNQFSKSKMAAILL
jgi:hypothetical protein